MPDRAFTFPRDAARRESSYPRRVGRGRRALITGVGGQDGSLLAELLLAEGYEVFGLVRRSIESYPNLEGLVERLDVVQADLTDQVAVVRALETIQPDEVYNLACASFVPASWLQPVATMQVTAGGLTALLEGIRLVNPQIRIFQASSSEIFGEPVESPQTEETPLSPISPYGIAKAYGHFLVRSYRDRYGLFAASGILYNHESERRPLEFLPRKVATAVAQIKLGLRSDLWLGDMSAERDWGYARDYVIGMVRALQADTPEDYIFATGALHSVEELVACAFGSVDLDWTEYVHLDHSLYRGKAEVHRLVGDATKARTKLDWKPSIGFESMIELLVAGEISRLAGGHAMIGPVPSMTIAP
jgi:GDPmannose 4,6-dehydratase